MLCIGAHSAVSWEDSRRMKRARPLLTRTTHHSYPLGSSSSSISSFYSIGDVQEFFDCCALVSVADVLMMLGFVFKKKTISVVRFLGGSTKISFLSLFLTTALLSISHHVGWYGWSSLYDNSSKEEAAVVNSSVSLALRCLIDDAVGALVCKRFLLSPLCGERSSRQQFRAVFIMKANHLFP